VARGYEAGKIVSVVCHGSCNLRKTRPSTGDLLAKGRTWTGFADSAEDFARSWIGRRIQRLGIEDEAKRIEGTNFVVGPMFGAFAVRDGKLITGQQRYPGAAAAGLLVGALGRRS
jgi:putative intracellular protease/amidase